jgi:hypothetical protein
MVGHRLGSLVLCVCWREGTGRNIPLALFSLSLPLDCVALWRVSQVIRRVFLVYVFLERSNPC